ncbi:MAG: hypothetical protein JO339_27910 [Alphaproteobacteria bacterium]|nr:hypothetical protein [Alphaproteobacteria bacterium]
MTAILSAPELRKQMAIAQGAKASAALKAKQAEEAEKQALIEKLRHPSPRLSDDEIVEKAAVMVNRAVENGLTSVQVLRFPHEICSDNGRAIHEAEEGWEETLSGVPKEVYEFWKRQLERRGYHIRYEVIDYPGGMPGDTGITLSWT